MLSQTQTTSFSNVSPNETKMGKKERRKGKSPYYKWSTISEAFFVEMIVVMVWEKWRRSCSWFLTKNREKRRA